MHQELFFLIIKDLDFSMTHFSQNINRLRPFNLYRFQTKLMTRFSKKVQKQVFLIFLGNFPNARIFSKNLTLAQLGLHV